VPDVRKLVAQAAELQAGMAERQQELAEQTFRGTAGGGMVTAAVTGLGDLVSVDIDASVVDPEDPELLGDLVVAAVNQAIAAMRDGAASLLGGDGGLPGGLDLGDLGGLLG
jgi:DNA-binding YbaB/EbfC family protein